MRQAPLTELRDCPRCRYREAIATASRPVDLTASTVLEVTLRGPHPFACTCGPTTPAHCHAWCPRCGADYALVLG